MTDKAGTTALDEDVVDKDSGERTGEPSGEASDRVEPVADPSRPKSDRSISIRTLAFSALVLVGIVVIAVLGWLLQDAWSENADMRNAARSDDRAEEVALDYATAAATMDYKDLGAWRESLTKGTSEELAKRLTKASESMEQIIAPLQWTSTSTPIAAKVESESGGVYEVLAFVSVDTRNIQAPEGVESTATYRMTLDADKDWQITEISGIGSALGSGPQPK